MPLPQKITRSGAKPGERCSAGLALLHNPKLGFHWSLSALYSPGNERLFTLVLERETSRWPSISKGLQGLQH